MVKEENAKVTIAPINAPIKTCGFNIDKSNLNAILFVIANCSIEFLYDAINAKAVNAADPIANPFPVAAVVFPKESNASVLFLTSAGNSAISAIPPALSATGPYASVANVIPNVDNIPTDDKDIPNNPILKLLNPPEDTKLIKIEHPIIITGAAVDFIPTDNPVIITVAAPVSDDLAILFVGL